MNWAKFIIIAFEVVGALITVAHVGKPRDAITGGVAVLTLIFTAALIWLVVIA